MSQSENSKEKIRDVFRKIIGVDPGDQDLRRQDVVEWDSLRHAELILKLQDQLKVKLTTMEMIQCESYFDILNVVSRKMQEPLP